MFKRAGRFVAANPSLATPASHEHEPQSPRWSVVAFRRGRDNMRRPRVYRLVWTFEREDKARAKMAKLDPDIYEDKRVCFNGTPVGSSMPSPIVWLWVDSADGVNANADPWSSSRYITREQGGPERTTDEVRETK